MKKLKGGWREGTVQEFLDLSDADVEYIETKLALSRRLRKLRTAKHMTQTRLAAHLQTSQSRVAKMEKADPPSPLTCSCAPCSPWASRARN